MSLVKHPEMTEKNRAAHRRNGRQSRGAVTPEGKERARAANLRHGIYSQQRDTALRALGAEWDPFFAKYMKPLTTVERDAAVMSLELAGKLERLRREESACYREFFRLERFLRKIQDRREESEAPEAEPGFDDAASEACGPEPEVEKPDLGSRSEGLEAILNSVGASGDVDENTGRGKSGAGFQVSGASLQVSGVGGASAHKNSPPDSGGVAGQPAGVVTGPPTAAILTPGS